MFVPRILSMDLLGLWVGGWHLFKRDCITQMPSGPIRLLSVELEDQMNIPDFCYVLCALPKRISWPGHCWPAGGGGSCNYTHVEGIIGLQKCFGRCQVPNRIYVNARMQVFETEHCTCNKISTVYSCYLLVVMFCLIGLCADINICYRLRFYR